MNKKAHIINVLLGITLSCSHAAGETLSMTDEFSAGLGPNWLIGTNTWRNDGGSLLAVENEQLLWNQQYDYVESAQTISGPFRVEVDLGRTTGSNQCFDFIIEPTGASGVSGIIRFQYGTYGIDSINLGLAPSLDSDELGECWDDGEYLQETTANTPHKGTASLTFQNDQVKFSYLNDVGTSIETPWIAVDEPFAETGIRIWALGSNGSRFVNAIRLYSLAALPEQVLPDSGGCVVVDDDLTINVNSATYDGGNFRFVLHPSSNPADPAGLYWKIDLESLVAQ